jgi:hypothetical protein
MNSSWRCLLAAALLVWGHSAAALESSAAEAVPPATGAEVLLFETDHLAGLGLPTRLQYRFAWNGESAFEDRVVLSINATRVAAVDYLSGDHHVNFPDVENARGNPLLLYFLEHDLREMQRMTGGSVTYFRRLVRRAFADPKLSVESVSAMVQGRQVSASRVSIEPFRADPTAPSRYPRLAGKRYEFVFSSAVPGGIVNVASVLPANGAGEGDRVRTALVEWTAAEPQ